MAALKDMFNREMLVNISDSLKGLCPEFDRKEFLALMPKLAALEMKPRVLLIRDELKRQLPQDYPKALKILLKSAKNGDLSGFALWPYTEFVQTYGLDHLQISLDALSELTKKFTSEWAIRPFIKCHTKETLKYLTLCARNKDVDLRRWSSEGTRPRLPWGERLQDFVRDPSPTLPILELLKHDEELYVRKSISNHLNDIAKDHPAVVIKILARWKKEAGDKHEDKVDWIIRRSLRTLIKDGHPEALKLIGVPQDPKIKFTDFKLTPKRIKMGEHLEFGFEIKSQAAQAQNLVVDYIIHFAKANKGTAPKVFKMKNIELPAKGVLKFTKRHHLKPITTRKYYSGRHFLEIQVNGKIVGKLDWDLKVP